MKKKKKHKTREDSKVNKSDKIKNQALTKKLQNLDGKKLDKLIELIRKS